MSVTDNPASPARGASERPGRLRAVLPVGRCAVRALASGWRRVRLGVIVRWQAARLDRDLADGVSLRSSDAHVLRAVRITGRRRRANLADGLARVLRSASDSRGRFSAAVPPDRRAVLAARPVIEALERRLLSPEPVAARGVAMLGELLAEPTSPLYRARRSRRSRKSTSRRCGGVGTRHPMGLIASESAPTGAAARALVVNAERQCLVGLRIVLRGAGYVVESARTAADALALVAEDPPDVLVLDLAPPDGVGAALCAGVRALSEVPILILSPVGAQREMVRALNAGADDYVPKPFRRQELLDRLRGLVVAASVGLRASSRLEVGDLVIDLVRRRVSRAGGGPAARAVGVRACSGSCSASGPFADRPAAVAGRVGGKNAGRTLVAFASLSRVCAPSWRGTRGIPGT